MEAFAPMPEGVKVNVMLPGAAGARVNVRPPDAEFISVSLATERADMAALLAQVQERAIKLSLFLGEMPDSLPLELPWDGQQKSTVRARLFAPLQEQLLHLAGWAQSQALLNARRL